MPPEALALLAAVSYALFTLCGWFGLQHSTPLAATIVSLLARTVLLWTAVIFTGGIPGFARLALIVFVILGILQSVTSLLTFVGLHRIGTSRSQPLRNTYPLWSAVIAILMLHERASTLIIVGTLLIVAGVVLISWKPDVPPPGYRWWHILYSLAAVVSLAGAAPYVWLSQDNRSSRWHPRGIFHFTLSGFFEGLGALLSLMALSSGRVVVISPIVATTPLWNLLLAIIFLRGKEEINARTIAGTISVVLGTVA